MFVVGELVRTVSNYDFHTKRIGLIIEIKYLKSVQYCRVLWSDENKQDYVVRRLTFNPMFNEMMKDIFEFIKNINKDKGES